jgi:hypothetical protein
MTIPPGITLTTPFVPAVSEEKRFDVDPPISTASIFVESAFTAMNLTVEKVTVSPNPFSTFVKSITVDCELVRVPALTITLDISFAFVPDACVHE